MLDFKLPMVCPKDIKKVDSRDHPEVQANVACNLSVGASMATEKRMCYSHLSASTLHTHKHTLKDAE